MNHNIVVIGPTKVGKTALISSLVQSANVVGYEYRDDDVQTMVVANNEITRRLFQQSLDIIRYNKVSFAGNQDIIEYEITLETSIGRSWLDKLKAMIGMGELQRGIINFPDAPGGALFQGDDDEYDTVVANKFRGLIVEQLRKTRTLLICIDASSLSNPDGNQNYLKEVALAFTKWLPDVFSEVVEGTGRTKLKIKRVCFVLTKSDLWAYHNDFQEYSETNVQNRDPYVHAKEILGKMFFNSIRNYFEKDTEFAFCMSSVFGFHNGDVNESFIANMNSKGRSQSVNMNVADWRPYNVIEPFIYLLNGVNLNSRIKEVRWETMGS
jgi:GTPase SAR1 family protein